MSNAPNARVTLNAQQASRLAQTKRYTISQSRTENARLRVEGLKSPYKRKSYVWKWKTVRSEEYARVYNASKHKDPGGRWLTKYEDIKGLTPRQIQDKFALPYTPTHITKATVPPGRDMAEGTVASKEFDKQTRRLKGGGTQYEYIMNGQPRLDFSKGERIGKRLK